MTEVRNTRSAAHRTGHRDFLIGCAVAVAGLLACVAPALGAGPASATSTTCPAVGGLTGDVSGSLTVSPGTDCYLNGHTVNGSVFVPAGAALISESPATITQSLIGTGGDIVFQNGTIGGAVSASGGGGDLSNDTIGGSVVLSHGLTGWRVSGDSITNALVLLSNSGNLALYANHVGGATTLSGNTTGPTMDVSQNVISGALQCQGNAPAPTHTYGLNNVGGSAVGQCTGFAFPHV